MSAYAPGLVIFAHDLEQQCYQHCLPHISSSNKIAGDDNKQPLLLEILKLFSPRFLKILHS